MSDVLQSHVIVHRVVEFLLATQILLCSLHRHMPKQKLNLLKFAACHMP
jgi:hypothetical protein